MRFAERAAGVCGKGGRYPRYGRAGKGQGACPAWRAGRVRGRGGENLLRAAYPQAYENARLFAHSGRVRQFLLLLPYSVPARTDAFPQGGKRARRGACLRGKGNRTHGHRYFLLPRRRNRLGRIAPFVKGRSRSHKAGLAGSGNYYRTLSFGRGCGGQRHAALPFVFAERL